jgi:transposase
MMENFNFFIGIDVSKLHLDYCLLKEGRVLGSFKGENTEEGIGKMLDKIVKSHKIVLAQTVFCMEHTGIYHYHLTTVLHGNNLAVCLENPAQIKSSMGLQRGKNDKIDAKRIALYAYKNKDDIKLWMPKRTEIILLTELLALKERLSDTRQSLATPVKEQKLYWDEKIYGEIAPYTDKVVKELDTQIAGVDKKIAGIINEDAHLKELFGLITSVPGVGKVTAATLIVQTNEFTGFTTARKFACYIGIAPFEYSSGTSVRGRTGVSPKANKKLKTLLQMGTMNFAKIKGKPNVFKEYYQRKVKEGKSKMSVLNALKNKIIHTIFAIVKNKQKFENKFEVLLA